MLVLFGITLAGIGLIFWELCPSLINPCFRPLFQLAVFLGIVASLVGLILHAAGVL